TRTEVTRGRRSRGRSNGPGEGRPVTRESRATPPDPPDEEPRSMAHHPTDHTDRRTFLQAGALATASAASLSQSPGARASAQDARGSTATVPRRPLGKTGLEVTMLDQGALRGPSSDRLLRHSFASGVRVFDTAKAYGTEPNFKKWFEQDPTVRKQIVLVTKD